MSRCSLPLYTVNIVIRYWGNFFYYKHWLERAQIYTAAPQLLFVDLVSQGRKCCSPETMDLSKLEIVSKLHKVVTYRIRSYSINSAGKVSIIVTIYFLKPNASTKRNSIWKVHVHASTNVVLWGEKAKIPSWITNYKTLTLCSQ